MEGMDEAAQADLQVNPEEATSKNARKKELISNKQREEERKRKDEERARLAGTLQPQKPTICNADTAQTDPFVQRQRFDDQLKDRQSGDDEAMAIEEATIKVLENGLPPCARGGIGIDRLTMLLTDSLNMKDLLVFPAMKPQDAPPTTGVVCASAVHQHHHLQL